MLITEATITNSNGDAITFGRHFNLAESLDLSSLSADVSYAESIRDGANYQRTALSVRDLDIPFYIKLRGVPQWRKEELRREIFKVLNPKQNPMRMDFVTKAREAYFVNLNLESTPSMPIKFEESNHVWQKVLAQFTCDDPFIYAAASSVEEIASWVSTFEFPLEIPEGVGIEMGYKSMDLIKNVFNEGDNEIGMIIEFKATTTVVTPSLINVNTYEQLQLNTTMQSGDVIRVNTNVGQKSVELTRNNIIIDAFNTVDLLSTFLQLEPGDNLFRYNANEGLEGLEVRMYFTSKFVGV